MTLAARIQAQLQSLKASRFRVNTLADLLSYDDQVGPRVSSPSRGVRLLVTKKPTSTCLYTRTNSSDQVPRADDTPPPPGIEEKVRERASPFGLQSCLRTARIDSSLRAYNSQETKKRQKRKKGKMKPVLNYLTTYCRPQTPREWASGSALLIRKKRRKKEREGFGRSLSFCHLRFQVGRVIFMNPTMRYK